MRTQPAQSGEPEPTARNPRDGKRIYERPAFRHETVFEVMALACGKAMMGPTCATMKKTS